MLGTSKKLSLLLALALAAAPVARATTPAPAPACPTVTLPGADEVVRDLMWGNFFFSKGAPVLPADVSPRLRATLDQCGQHPKAIVLSCIDSRVPPDHVFRQGLGEIFASRVAGNVPLVGEIASVEYAVEHLHVPVVFVLGHTKCGAVNAAGSKYADPALELTPALEALVAEIMPAIEATLKPDGTPDTAAAVHANAHLAARNLLCRSEVVRSAVEAGATRVVVGVYDLATGLVTIEEPRVAVPASCN